VNTDKKLGSYGVIWFISKTASVLVIGILDEAANGIDELMTGSRDVG
jgi:hypothetical protein